MERGERRFTSTTASRGAGSSFAVEAASRCHPRRAERGKGIHGAEHAGGSPSRSCGPPGMTAVSPSTVLALSPVMAGPVLAIPIGQGAALFAIGITALDTLSRHGRACPGHPDDVRRCACRIGIPGTGPGMTAEGSRRVCNVLTLFLTLCFICAIPLLIPARRGARSRGVARVGRGAVLQQASQACWREALGSPVLVQVRLKVPRARRRPALPIHHPHRAGLPVAPPSITPQARSHKLRAYGCWLFDVRRIGTAPITTFTSWPGLSRPSRSDERGASIHRDHRDKPGDDVGECHGRT